MEITLSKRKMFKVALLLMIVAVACGLYIGWSQEILQTWFGETPGPTEASLADEPALQSLAVMYSPAGERLVWEEQVCSGMTEPGCELFRAMFADPIWRSSVYGKTATVAFVASMETLEDGSQVWKTEVTDGDVSSPVYIHVAQNESGHWLLNRVLFAQEAAKYEGG